MKKYVCITLCLCFLTSISFAEVIFEDNFNSYDAWTVTQPTGSTESCFNFLSAGCDLPGDWAGFYNGACLCDGISGEPGNNLMYINQYAGYPNETNTCRGGTGKCLTHWQESCISHFDNSDGKLYTMFDGEYEDLYVRFFMRFKEGFELRTLDAELGGFAFKLVGVQHYLDGSPTQYHDTNQGNQPTISSGFKQYSTGIYFYAEARCYDNYYCHNHIQWYLGTETWAYAEGGIFDGNWHSIEVRFKINSSVGTADGAIELWLNGTKKSYLAGYEGDDIELIDEAGGAGRGWKMVGIGGNSSNQWDTSPSTMADAEQWYAIDDVVVSTEYIGTDYVINNGGPPPITSASGFIISGGRIN